MNSIIDTKGRRKCIVYKRERNYRLVRGDLGVQMRRESISLWGHRKTPRRAKGDIKGFSENSRSRLRVLLSTARWKSETKCFRCGLTFTLPWAASPEEWRTVWNAFVKRMIKRFQDVGMIWRIELTTGKAKKSGGLRRAHVHAIFWIPSTVPAKYQCLFGSGMDDDAFRLVRLHHVRDLSRAWCDAWQYYAPSLTEEQVKYAISVGERKGNGIVVKWLDGSTDGAIHYLCDHTSKHKDEQLGWQGRQWGVVNRRNFEWKDDGEVIDGRVWALTSRQLRRLGKCLRRGDGYAAQPYGDNKCFFGVAQKRLEDVLQAVKAGRIGEQKGKG